MVPETKEESPAPFNRQVAAARKARYGSLDNMAFALRAALPVAHQVSREYLRRLEAGTIPKDHLDLLLVAALTELLDLPLADSDRAQVRQIEELMASIRSRCQSLGRAWRPMAATG